MRENTLVKFALGSYPIANLKEIRDLFLNTRVEDHSVPIICNKRIKSILSAALEFKNNEDEYFNVMYDYMKKSRIGIIPSYPKGAPRI